MRRRLPRVKWSLNAVRRFSVPLLRQNDPNEIGCVSGVKLVHDPRPVDFDCPGTDPELPASLLVGGAMGDLLQHFPFTRRQQLFTWKIRHLKFDALALHLVSHASIPSARR
jgi:hypothetical protein